MVGDFKLRRFLLSLFTALIALTTFPTGAETNKKVAIIIDDFGNNMTGTEEILNLPVPITAAVMPFLSTTKRDAQWAYEKGHDVFVHLPMEPKRGKKSWLGPGVISTDLTDEEIRKRVIAAIDDVPHAIGVNNHMGSKATGDRRVMRIVLEVCKEHGMIYLDSKTNSKSVIPSVAKELEVPYIENHLFLDDRNQKIHIRKQFNLILDHLSEKEDVCIAIGHVGVTGKQTASVLKDVIPLMQQKATFVKVSELVNPSLLEEVHQK